MGCGVSQENLNTTSLPSNDRYQRKELIGVGHHGRVYKTYYELDKKQYANKVIDQFRPNTILTKVQSQSSQLINRLKKLRNDKIVSYYQMDFTQKEVSIVMQLSKEGTLKKYIQKNGPVNQEKSSNYIQGILQGLEYLHNAGLIHKDLKSTNILLMPKGEIKISDYGLAEIYDERLTDKNSKINNNQQIDFYRGESLPYMAPQVIKNIEIIDKSDVWSLGCILVELLTGETPWQKLANNFQKTFEMISNMVTPPLPKNISNDCQSFLESCLAVIPTQRLSVFQLLRHKFITKYTKNSALFFAEDTSIDNIKLTVHNDKSSNSKQKKDKSNNKTQQINSFEQKQKNSSPQANQSQSRKKRRQKLSREIDDNIIKIREVLHSIDTKKQQQSNSRADKRDDQKPIMSLQQPHTIILNNKKIQLDPARYKNVAYTRRLKTQQNEWNSPPRDRSRAKHSIQIQNINLDSSKQYYDPHKKYNYSQFQFEDSLDAQLKHKNLRIQTQPNASQYTDRQYFKKPLKLLKKKIKQSKQSNDFSRKLTSDASKTAMKHEMLRLDEEKQDDFNPISKIRAYTQSKRQDRVIDTQIARAQRDRFLNQQKIMKKLRDQQKYKWEQQLKKGAQILKGQYKRYYYNPIMG